MGIQRMSQMFAIPSNIARRILQIGGPQVRGFLTGTLTLLALVGQGASADTKLYFVHNDHLGTPIMVTDSTQAVVWEGVKAPFGDTEETTATIEFDSRFPGQYLDRESGLHYNYFRDYDPSLGRYIQADPVGILARISDPTIDLAVGQQFSSKGLSTGLNHLYGYAGQNPARYFDPLGLIITAIRIEVSDQFAVFHTPDDTGRSCPVNGDDLYDGFQYLGRYTIMNPPCTFICYFTDREWKRLERRSNPGIM